jgi:hypothetical protein
MDFAATDASKGKRGKDIVILPHHNCAPCLKCLALKAPNDPSPLLTEKRPTPWRSKPGRGKSRLAIESIDDRYCRSLRGVMPSRPAQLALIYEWRRAPPQQHSPLLWKLYMPAIGKFSPSLRSTGTNVADSIE